MANPVSTPDSGILRIAYLPQGAFVPPILTRLHGSRSAALRQVLAEWQTSGLADLAMSVSTKLTMLSQLAERLFRALDPLIAGIRQVDVAEHMSRGAGVVFQDRLAPYRLLLEVDAFIYEFRSFYEILGKFVGGILAKLGKTASEKDIVAHLVARNVDMSWGAELREHRKILFHERAPWLAVLVKSAATDDYDFTVLLSPDSDPKDPDQAISFRRLAAIYTGMEASLRHMQRWILDEIELLDH